MPCAIALLLDLLPNNIDLRRIYVSYHRPQAITIDQLDPSREACSEHVSPSNRSSHHAFKGETRRAKSIEPRSTHQLHNLLFANQLILHQVPFLYTGEMDNAYCSSCYVFCPPTMWWRRYRSDTNRTSPRKAVVECVL